MKVNVDEIILWLENDGTWLMLQKSKPKKISSEKLFPNNLMPNFSAITSLAVVYYVAIARICRHYHELPS